jgi:DNA polymerase-1
LTPEEGHQFIEAYYQTYPRVKEYIAATKRQAREEGYVQTLLGRRRYFPELKSHSRAHAAQIAAADRMAINAPIQGSAADIIKIAMIRVHQRIRAEGLRALTLLQVHDELVFEVPDEERNQTIEAVRSEMETAFELDIPLKVDVEIGPNWEELEAI